MAVSALSGTQNSVRSTFVKRLGPACAANTQDVFPEDVQYFTTCGCVCRTTSTFQELRLYDNIIEGLSACAARFGVGRSLSAADVVLALEVYSATGLVTVHFVDFREARGQIAHVKPGHVPTKKYGTCNRRMPTTLLDIIYILLLVSSVFRHQ